MNKVEIKVDLEEPVYLDKNTVKIGVLFNGKRVNDIIARFNGKTWTKE